MSADGWKQFLNGRRTSGRGLGNSFLLNESAAGLLLSGDSGTGKSNGMQVIAHQLINAGYGLTLLDPHGDLVDDLEAYCAAQPPSCRRRVIVIRYSDTTRITGMNPLFVDRTGINDITFKARLASRVGHVARILIYAFGEKNLNGKPLLTKWIHRVLTILATTGLTIPDARHCFDVTSPVYQAMAESAPDFVAQMEMQQLAELRPAEREEQIGSTKNRFLNFLQNPIVELVLGKPDGHIDFRNAIQERSIILISFARGGVLREEDVEIFANLCLLEILYAIFNTPRADRVPHFVLLDELPTFRSSFDIITTALAQVRKFLCRFVVAFQGTQLFDERQQDRLLNALIGQCDMHFYFRHKNPVDAKFFSEIIKMPSLEMHKVKHEQTQQQQYQDGHELVTLVDTSENTSEASQDGGSSSNAVSNTNTTSTGSGESFGESTSLVANAVSQARGEQSNRSSSASSSAAQGQTETNGASWSRTQTTGSSVTRKQTLVPRLRTRQIVTSVQFYSTEEQFLEAARDFTTLPRGTCFLYLAGQGVYRVRLPLAKSPISDLPRYAAKKIAELRRDVFARPEFDSPENLQRLRIEFEQKLVQFLHDARNAEHARIAEAIPVLIVPTTSDNSIIQI